MITCFMALVVHLGIGHVAPTGTCVDPDVAAPTTHVAAVQVVSDRVAREL